MAKGVLELEEELSSKPVFYLTPTAESHSTAHCYYRKAKSLSACVLGSVYILCVSRAVVMVWARSLRSNYGKSQNYSVQDILTNSMLLTLWQQFGEVPY